tara:strand:+ start:878 stop:1000 length:123 start_codon:yes stop_codon:yes gene_type:complete
MSTEGWDDGGDVELPEAGAEGSKKRRKKLGEKQDLDTFEW